MSKPGRTPTPHRQSRASRPKHRPQSPANRATSAEDRVLLYGLHPVEAALRNPLRPVYQLFATQNTAERLKKLGAARGLSAEIVTPKDLDRRLGRDAVHQGAALEAGPLPPHSISDLSGQGLLLILDQVTDPHNAGALLRSAAAFGAEAVIMQARHSPPLTGTLAKSASGALDLVPVILTANLAAAMETAKEKGYWLIGLAEEAPDALVSIDISGPLGLVLGAEGKGLRHLTRERCDQLCRISTATALASLNVSNAGAIALHWARSKRA